MTTARTKDSSPRLPGLRENAEKYRRASLRFLRLCAVSLSVLLLGLAPAFDQVGPAEIKNLRLKASEQTYLSQLMAVNRAISEINFPFNFSLNRYVGLDPKQQIGSDKRGLEFVNFHDRQVLKVTGNYNAAFSASLLSPNQRSSRVFDEVIFPILRLLPDHFGLEADFDAFGFEIGYHVRQNARGYGYEGKEILVVVLDKADALGFTKVPDQKRQGILNRSEIYLDGKPFGLALGASHPFDVEGLERSVRNFAAAARVREGGSSAPGGSPSAAPMTAVQSRPLDLQKPIAAPPAEKAPEKAPDAKVEQSSALSKPDIDALQKKYQPQLDNLAKEGAAKYHLVDYAPPSFVVFRNQAALQMTLRNIDSFDKDATSIYKRAARSFDLFLAPELKAILDRIPDGSDFSSLDVTVLNELTSKSAKSSEAIEFIFPLNAARQFAAAEITNQDLINQSVVLVNGVRIGLNLQQVE